MPITSLRTGDPPALPSATAVEHVEAPDTVYAHARLRLLHFCGVLTLALNTAEPLLTGHYDRACLDTIAPLLLLGWGRVGPAFLAQFHTATDPTPHLEATTTSIPAPSPVTESEPDPAPAPEPATPAPEPLTVATPVSAPAVVPSVIEAPAPARPLPPRRPQPAPVRPSLPACLPACLPHCWTPRPTTTRARSCSTLTPQHRGPASRSTCAARSPPGSASPRRPPAPSYGSPSPRSPSTRSAAWSTSTPSSGSTDRTAAPSPHRRPPRSPCSPMPSGLLPPASV